MEIARDSETAAKLAADNPVVPRGLLIVEKDTGMAKLGDGATRWNSLGYWSPDGSVQEIVAGANVTIDGSDPQRPVISAAGYTPTPQEVDPESETLAEDLLGALVALGLVVEAE